MVMRKYLKYSVHKSLSDETQKYIELRINKYKNTSLMSRKTTQSELKDFGHILFVFILRYISIYYH